MKKTVIDSRVRNLTHKKGAIHIFIMDGLPSYQALNQKAAFFGIKKLKEQR
jgi:hypothetical protein